VHDEVEIMHKVHHPHAVELVEMFETKKKIWMVMELLTGGELFDRIVSKGSYSEKEASGVVRAVASALEYLHATGITHRDLKPENLLYKSPDQDAPIKLTDFGLAKYRSAKEQDGGMLTACGTPGYVSPEIVMNVRYTSKTDVWSLGVIIYILLCGFPPFYSESTHQLYQQIKAGDYSFPSPYWSDISSQAKDLIRHCLQVDPNKRFSASQVLHHPWVGGLDVSTKAIAGGYSKRLIVLQARRRLRRGILMIHAINRFARVIEGERTAPAAVHHIALQEREGHGDTRIAPAAMIQEGTLHVTAGMQEVKISEPYLIMPPSSGAVMTQLASRQLAALSE